MKHLILMAALFSAAACAIPTAVPDFGKEIPTKILPPPVIPPPPADEPAVPLSATSVTFAGSCTPVRFTTACDVQFIGNYDLGTGFVQFFNVTTWDMLSGAEAGKTIAPFTFRARWRDGWGRVGPWSQWVDFTHNTATGVTTSTGMRAGSPKPTCFGTICIPAPTADRLTYALVP